MSPDTRNELWGHGSTAVKQLSFSFHVTTFLSFEAKPRNVKLLVEVEYRPLGVSCRLRSKSRSVRRPAVRKVMSPKCFLAAQIWGGAPRIVLYRSCISHQLLSGYKPKRCQAAMCIPLYRKQGQSVGVGPSRPELSGHRWYGLMLLYTQNLFVMGHSSKRTLKLDPGSSVMFLLCDLTIYKLATRSLFTYPNYLRIAAVNLNRVRRRRDDHLLCRPPVMIPTGSRVLFVICHAIRDLTSSAA